MKDHRYHIRTSVIHQQQQYHHDIIKNIIINPSKLLHHTLTPINHLKNCYEIYDDTDKTNKNFIAPKLKTIVAYYLSIEVNTIESCCLVL
jgi:hypothetical protein